MIMTMKIQKKKRERINNGKARIEQSNSTIIIKFMELNFSHNFNLNVNLTTFVQFLLNSEKSMLSTLTL